MGWSPRPGRFTPGKETQYPLYRRLDGPPGPVWTGAENFAPTGFQSPDCPACSESLYRLSYASPQRLMLYRGNFSRVTKGKSAVDFSAWGTTAVESGWPWARCPVPRSSGLYPCCSVYFPKCAPPGSLTRLMLLADLKRGKMKVTLGHTALWKGSKALEINLCACVMTLAAA